MAGMILLFQKPEGEKEEAGPKSPISQNKPVSRTPNSASVTPRLGYTDEKSAC